MSFAAIEQNRYQQKRAIDSEDAILKVYQVAHSKTSKIVHAICRSETKRMVTGIQRQSKLVDQGKVQESEVQESIVKQAGKECSEHVARRNMICERLYNKTQEVIVAKTLRRATAMQAADRALRELSDERAHAVHTEEGHDALNISTMKLLGERDAQVARANMFGAQIAELKAQAPLDCSALALAQVLNEYHFFKKGEKIWFQLEGKHMLMAEEVDAIAKKTAADMGAPLEMVGSLKMEGRAGMTIGKAIKREEDSVNEATEQRREYGIKAEARLAEAKAVAAADITVNDATKAKQVEGLNELQHARALELMQQVAALTGKLSAPKHVNNVKEVRKAAQADLAETESQ